MLVFEDAICLTCHEKLIGYPASHHLQKVQVCVVALLLKNEVKCLIQPYASKPHINLGQVETEPLYQASKCIPRARV